MHVLWSWIYCCRTALLDVSEDDFNHTTPVMPIAPSGRESGKKQVKRRIRRKRASCTTCAQTAKQRNTQTIDVTQKLDVIDTESSSDERQWATRVRKNENMKPHKKGKKQVKSHDGSSDSNAIAMVPLSSKDSHMRRLNQHYPLCQHHHQEQQQQQQHISNFANNSTYHRRRKPSKFKESSISTSSGSSVETKRYPNRRVKRKVKSCCTDTQKCQCNFTEDKVIKKNVREEGTGAETLAPVPAAHCESTATRVNCDEWDDDLDVCRSVFNHSNLVSKNIFTINLLIFKDI